MFAVPLSPKASAWLAERAPRAKAAEASTTM
jgi:hypothetical protein